jgi:transposase InsO family protein/G:T-mismatch repair DNA endonuclease (very short patch repair protein)
VIKIEECLLTISNGTDDDLTKKLTKVHKQLSHPTQDKFINLLKDAKVWEDEYKCILEHMYDKCETCLVFRKTPPRPVVAMPEASRFRELLVMDLKKWNNVYILHMIDAWSRFSISAVIKQKLPQVVAHEFLLKWLGGGYGPPDRIKFDNGGEFSNEEITEMSELLDMEITTTAGESPWQNGLCERNHAVTDRCLEKMLHDDPKLPLNVALAYAVNAKNSLQMWSGFSSYQLFFGENPGVPNMFTAKPPQLKDHTASETVAIHLNALHSGRKAFIESESCDKIRRALRSNIRTKLEKYESGDKVYYKREDSNQWKGPGIVIGQDKQVVFVRHGGYYVRVSTNRLMKVPNTCIQNEDIAQNISNDGQLPTVVEKSALKGVSPITEKVGTPDITTDGKQAVGTQPVQVSFKCVPQKGDDILYKIDENGEWKSASVVSRGGKQTGKYKEWINIKEPDSMTIVGLDLSNVYDWKLASETPIEIEISKDIESEEVRSEEETALVVMVPRSEHDHPDVIKAKKKELSLWRDMGVYEEVDDCGQNRLSTNWVVSRKMVEGKMGCKARLVCRGYEEENTARVDSPTCARSTMRIFFTLAAALEQKIHAKDVKSAFLQGKGIERDVYIIPPVEEYQRNILWKLNKVVYGLNDASRNWYQTVLKEMNKTGCQASVYDGALFYYKLANELAGMMVCHVDDFLDSGNEDFSQNVMNKITQKFKIGKEEDTAFRYVGVNVQQTKENIIIDQDHFIQELEPINLSAHQASNKQKALNKSEQRQFRSLVGQLNWVSTTTRPDISFEVLELSMMFKHPTIADIIRLNKAVKKVKSQSVWILFPKMSIDNSLCLLAISDAAFANLVDRVSSGAGYIILLCDKDRKCCPLVWTSNKIQRVVNSTLAAEMLSLSNAVKEAQFLRAIIIELVGSHINLPIKSIVDNQSVKDALYSNKMVDDKRLRIETAALKQFIDTGELLDVTYLPGDEMLADSLTKRGASSQLLLETLTSGILPAFIPIS